MDTTRYIFRNMIYSFTENNHILETCLKQGTYDIFESYILFKNLG